MQDSCIVATTSYPDSAATRMWAGSLSIMRNARQPRPEVGPPGKAQVARCCSHGQQDAAAGRDRSDPPAHLNRLSPPPAPPQVRTAPAPAQGAALAIREPA